MNPQQLKEFIENFIQCYDNEKRKALEVQIENLINNKENLKLFLDTIFYCKDQKNVLDMIFQFLAKMDFKRFDDIDLNLLKDFFSQMFFSNDVNQHALEQSRDLAELYCTIPIMSDLVHMRNCQKIQQLLIQNIKQQISQGEINLTKSLGIIQTLNITFRISKLLEIEGILKETYQIVKLIEQDIFYTVLSQIDGLQFNDLNEQQRHQYNQCLLLIKLFAEYYNIVLVKTTSRSADFSYVEDNQQLLQTFIDILFYDFFKCGNKLCLMIRNQQQYGETKTIFQTKINIVEVLFYILYQKDRVILTDYLKKYIFENILDNFISFFSKEIRDDFDIRDIQDYKYLCTYIQKIIQVLGKGFSDINNFQKLNDIKYMILTEVFCKAFYQTNQELENFKENKNEFHNNFLDLISYQNSKTIKNQLIKLFRKYTIVIDGTCSSYFKMALEIIYKNFEGLQKYSDVQYKYINKLKDSSFFICFDSEKQIEIALTILIHLNETILKRKDMQISLDYLLKRHIQNIIQSNTLNQVKLLYLLDLIIKHIPLDTDNDQQFKTSIVQWVLTKALQGDDISFYASHNISIVSKSQLLDKLGDNFSEQYLKTICQQLIQSKQYNNSVYLLAQFVETRLEFLLKNELNFMLILTSIQQCIQFYLQTQDNIRNSQIYNVLKLLDSICAKTKIVQKYADFIEEKMVNIFQIVNQVKDTNDFTNYLISIFSQNILENQKFRNFQNVVLQEVKKSCDQCYFEFDEYFFYFMSRTMFYNQELFDQQTFDNYLYIIIYSLKMSMNNKVYDLELPIMLLHVLIVDKGEMLSTKNIEEIYQIYIELTQIQEFMIESEEFILLIIISLILTQKQQIINLMKQEFFRFVQSLLDNSILFSTFYDIKFFQVGLLEIFLYLYQLEEQQDLLFQVFQTIILHFKFYQNKQIVDAYFGIRQHQPLNQAELIYVENQNRYIQLLNYPFEQNQWYLSRYPKNQRQKKMSDDLDESSDNDSHDYIMRDFSTHQDCQKKKEEKTKKIFAHFIAQADQFAKLNQIVLQLRKEQKFINLNQKLSQEVFNITSDVFFYTKLYKLDQNGQQQINIRKVVQIDYSVFGN